MHEVGPTEELYWMGRPEGYTPAQFDLLVDYLLRVCERSNYEAIGGSAWFTDEPGTEASIH